jgi:hypothetical protein
VTRVSVKLINIKQLLITHCRTPYIGSLTLQRWIGAPTALYGRERRFERSDEILLRHGCIPHAQIAQHAVE